MFEIAIRNKANTIHVNDTHSKLNPSWVREIARPTSAEDVQRLVLCARNAGLSISIAGARHAMGGQQFGAGTILCDTASFDAVLSLDVEHGLVEVEAGITWPKLVADLHRLQPGSAAPWTIAQKQTGADRLSIGGAVAANIHGRGLVMRPFIGDIEELSVVTADGARARCSRG
ncbi:MAG: FAD-dependent oxidoreductase, partial [Candidatus Hydrogenedentes bacterium]|nr:FAD-dependent oxidoreductase [Candidatus Hydrogenedentota bacterium]